MFEISHQSFKFGPVGRNYETGKVIASLKLHEIGKFRALVLILFGQGFLLFKGQGQTKGSSMKLGTVTILFISYQNT